jgi:sortase A
MNDNTPKKDQSLPDDNTVMLNGKPFSCDGESSSSYIDDEPTSCDNGETTSCINGEPAFTNNDAPNLQKKNFNKNSIISGILLVIPFIIFCAGIYFISIFVFKEYIESSNLWRFIVNTNAVASPEQEEGEELLSNGEIIGGSFDNISIAPVEKPDIQDTSEDLSTDESDEVDENQIYYNKKDFPGYKWGALWAKLSIPTIGLENKNVYAGESNSIYKKGIGKRFGTRFPGQGGNIVLGAHVTREFYDLQLLKVGDKVYIETEYGDYIYEVFETKIFSIADYSYVMNYDKGEQLTLYTCHPRGTAYRTERFGVFCKKISGPEWIEIN